MKRSVTLPAALLILAACAYKLPEAQVLKIFEKHSFREYAPAKLSALMREKGLAGLKTLDRYADVVTSNRPVKFLPGTPAPSPGMLADSWDGKYNLVRVFKGSPAERSGLRYGDRLLAVNSQLPGSRGFLKALSGRQDLAIRAARRSKAGISEFDAVVKAEPFSPPLVFGFYEPRTGTAFVRIGLFFKDAASIAASGLAGLEKYGAKSVILDLRGNKGGSPDEAADLLRLFARKPGPVMRINSRHKGYTRVYLAKEEGRFSGLRAAVLTDGGTAMAGEVFAAAMKELAGAQVIGSPTAGDVSIQKTFSIGEGRGLRLTVARLAPPSGPDLEGAGLQPDTLVPGSREKRWVSPSAVALLDDAAYQKALGLLARGAPRRGTTPPAH